MTTFLEMNALQPPFDVGVDTSNRAMVSFNLLCNYTDPPINTLDKIATYISSNGLGVVGTSIFYGPKGIIPQSGDGPFISLIATGGLSGIQTHNGNKQTRPTVQVLTRATSYTAAINRANAVYAILDGKHNISL